MKKTKLIALLLAAVLCAGLFTACNSGGGTTPSGTQAPGTATPAPAGTGEPEGEETEAPEERTALIVGFDASFPPYGYQDENGEYVGFDLDLAAEVCARRGWELIKQPIDWSAKDMEINSGTIDCIWNGFTMTEERLSQYEWSSPYVDNSQVFVVKADSGIVSLEDLAGKVVAVQAASSAEDALNDEDNAELLASFAEVVPVADYLTAFMNLESGAVDAIAIDIGVAQYQIDQRGAGLVIMDELLATELYGIGFKLGNAELRNQVEETLTEMAGDGTLDEIAEAWGLQDSVVFGK